MPKFQAALIRAARTLLQTAVALIPTTAVTLNGVQWDVVASGAALAGLVSLLTGLATALPEVPTDG